MEIKAEITGERIEGDGLWTFDPHTPLGVRVADCVPILLAGLVKDRPWIAALHAGWRGTVNGMLRKGVESFFHLGGDPAALWYAFGPCIQACHLEVGPEVIAQAQTDPAWTPDLAMPGVGDRHFLDLHGLLAAQAAHMGLDSAKNGSVKRCTLCERDLFYSYRGGDTHDRQWGLVELKRQ